MLQFIFETIMGKYAPITAGALGILGSLALAIPPIENRNIRTVLLQLEDIGGGISDNAFRDAKKALTREARRLLKKERFWNLLGAILLVLAFVALFLNSIYCTSSPIGTCS